MSTVSERITGAVAAQGTAGTDQSTVVAESHVAGTVTEVSFTPNAAVVANGTNYRTFTLQNKGQDGSGTTAVATYNTSATGLTAADEMQFTLSGTSANLTVAKGDVLAVVETHAAAGVAHGGGRVEIEIERTA